MLKFLLRVGASFLLAAFIVFGLTPDFLLPLLAVLLDTKNDDVLLVALMVLVVIGAMLLYCFFSQFDQSKSNGASEGPQIVPSNPPTPPLAPVSGAEAEQRSVSDTLGYHH